MMKHIKTVMTALIAGMFAACTQDVAVEPVAPTMIPVDEEGVEFYSPGISLPEGEGNHDMTTRASYYDGKLNGVYFTWVESDKLGIFPAIADASQVKMNFYQLTSTGESSGGVSKALFKPESMEFAWQGGQKYRAYYPYTTAATEATNIPMDYSNQTQTGKPNLSDYFAGGTKEDYYNTEKTASAHLTAASFLVSDEQTAESASSMMHFKMSHIGGVVRFYLVLPTTLNADITEVRLVATKPVFHETAKLDITTGTTTPTGEATNNLTLKLTGAHVKYTASTDERGNYLIAYMMAYPVALTTALAAGDGLYIYAKGKNTDKEDVYFRSVNLTKKDISAGKLTQFSVYENTYDEPIDMQAITVQQWQKGLEIDNGGKGTENW